MTDTPNSKVLIRLLSKISTSELRQAAMDDPRLEVLINKALTTKGPSPEVSTKGIDFEDIIRKLPDQIVKINDFNKIPEKYYPYINRVKYVGEPEGICELQKLPNLKYIDLSHLSDDHTFQILESAIHDDCIDVFVILYESNHETAESFKDDLILVSLLSNPDGEIFEYLYDLGANPLSDLYNHYLKDNFHNFAFPENFDGFVKLYTTFPIESDVWGDIIRSNGAFLNNLITTDNINLVKFLIDNSIGDLPVFDYVLNHSNRNSKLFKYIFTIPDDQIYKLIKEVIKYNVTFHEDERFKKMVDLLDAPKLQKFIKDITYELSDHNIKRENGYKFKILINYLNFDQILNLIIDNPDHTQFIFKSILDTSKMVIYFKLLSILNFEDVLNETLPIILFVNGINSVYKSYTSGKLSKYRAKSYLDILEIFARKNGIHDFNQNLSYHELKEKLSYLETRK